ncbi:Aflatoxin biosynthesis regulatory protein [Penicillium rolfsii]|nr:Aflatoxin biosynthesis regulatory protein [Penicillium rolfsii]
MMAQSTSTTTPGNAITATPKPLKLKASCDFCALTKVKCDQKHPQCLRCIKSGVVCHYSETRRIGKARQLYAASHRRNNSRSPSAQGAWRQQSSSASPPLPNTTALAETVPRSLPKNQPSHDRCRSSEQPMSLNLFDNFFTQAVVSNENPESMEGQGTQSMTIPHSTDYDREVGVFLSPESPNDLLQHMNGSRDMTMDDADYIHEMELSGDQAWLSALPDGPMLPSPGHAEDCIQRVFVTLQVLHVVRASCTWSSRPARIPVRTLDTALKNNRAAMDTVREVLDCPCAHNMKVALPLVMITHQVMESYRAILAQQSSPSSPQRSGPETDVSLCDTPLAIGGYILDNEMRSKVLSQVIRSELDKMGTLLTTFARYAEGMSKQPDEAVLRTYIHGLQETRDDMFQSLEQQPA